jgi:glycosyltransferase involved in cell wall biosynthesis
VRLSFVYPSSGEVTGGIAVLYHFANGLSQRGHEVHFLHGTAFPGRVDDVADLPPLCTEADVHHHIVDSFDQPGLPEADVIFVPHAPRRLGRPASFVQGYKMLSDEVERGSFLGPGPKFCVASWLCEAGVSAYGADPASMVHTPIGIDHDLWQPRHGFGAAQRPIDVAAMAHIHREKGWPVLAEAIERLLAIRPGLRIVAFGRYPTAIPDGVEMLDEVDAETLVDDVYGRCKVFVQSSRHEGFGYTPVEAMACGAALVTTDCGGSREYAIHGSSALVVPPDDPTALAAAVAELLDDEARRSAIARVGERLVRRFDWETGTSILERYLEDYLERPEHYAGGTYEVSGPGWIPPATVRGER